MKRVIIVFTIYIAFLSCNNKNSRNISNEELLHKAEKYYEQENYHNALRHYEMIIERDSIAPEFFYRKGICLAKLFSFEESINAFIFSAKLGYREVDSYYNIGLNHSILLNDSLALHFFEKALEIDSTDTEIKNAKEEILISLKDQSVQ
jgi:tetratricopeptide (TPR) repeat protein